MLKFSLIIVSLAIIFALCDCRPGENLYLQNLLRHSIDSLNKAIDPCENFHKFACSNWKDNSYKDSNELMKYRSVLEIEDDIILYNTDIEGPVKDFYKLCLKEPQPVSEIGGYKAFKKFASELGDFPVLNEHWDEKKFDFLEIETKLQEHGLYAFFKIDVQYGEILFDSCPFNTIPNFLDIHFREHVPKISIFFQNIFNLNPNEAHKIAKEILEVQSQICFRDVKNEYFKGRDGYGTFGILKDAFPKINLTQLLLNIFDAEYISKKTAVFISSPDYIDSVVDFVEKTPKAIVANYMLWRGLSQLMPKDNKFDYNYILKKAFPYINDGYANWEKCVEITKTIYSEPIDAMILEKFNDDNSAQEIHAMLDIIRRSSLGHMKNILHFDENAWKLVNDKFNLINFQYSGLPTELDEDEIAASKDPIHYLLKLIAYLQDQNLEKMQSKSRTLTVKAKLESGEHIIQLKTHPHYNNYEMSNNTLSIQYQNIIPILLHYRSEPKEYQYARFGGTYINAFYGLQMWTYLKDNAADIENLGDKLRAEHFMCENIDSADEVVHLSNLRSTFDGYRYWLELVKENNKDLYDKELKWGSVGEYSNEKMFFIQFMQEFCDESSASVNRAIKYNKYFGNVFNCERTSTMNPTNKCYVF